MPPRDFDAIKFLGTLGWLPTKERLALRHLHIACSQGLAAARQRRLTEAAAHYAQAEAQLGGLEAGTRLAWLLGVSTYEAGVAYLHFQYDSGERAVAGLERSMDADLELEGLGLPIMLLHRIQQGHNLARMDFRSRRRDGALGLTGLLLGYMERHIDGLPYHLDWPRDPSRAVPRELLQQMMQQILGEAAGFILTGDDPVAEWRKLLAGSRLSREPARALFPQLQYALSAQANSLAEDSEGYLWDLERFFRLGIRGCPSLWYMLLVELVSFCRRLDTVRSRQVESLILHDSPKWSGFPSFLRGCLHGFSPA
jgi:hypothetical protein